MASWIIVAAFVATAIYLIVRSRNFSPLPMVSSIGTAMILCFFGFLFAAASNALLKQISSPIDDPFGQALMVVIGISLGLLIRHRWKQSSPARSTASDASTDSKPSGEGTPPKP
ncbi:MAG: hypothetical protein V7752_11860 [Halopseudomonas sp.]